MARVLVVDDEADIREVVRLNLELDGHEVLEASGGAQALDAARQELPDLLVLDVMMPGIDGWAVLAEMKADEGSELAHIPVIMLTARVGELDRIRGGIEGAVRYIAKPFSIEALRTAVAAAIEGEPELVQRREAQRSALQRLAMLEKGGPGTAEVAAGPRPHLTRLENPPAPPPSLQASVRQVAAKAGALSPKQRALLAAVGDTASVQDAAERLGVSRSNVYASLARIARRLGVKSVADLVGLARQGTFTPGR
jgi:CheY-like chemotaxis protein